MVPFGKGYFYHDGHVFKEIKPSGLTVHRWKLLTKDGKRKWISEKQILKILENKNK